MKTQNIIGHKGISVYKMPENTIPALKTALEKSFSIETDLQRVKDGYVLVHDKYIPGLNDKGKYEGRTKIETHSGNGFYFPLERKLVTECTVNELLTGTVFDKVQHEAALTRHAGELVSLELTENPKIAIFNELLLLLKTFPQSRTYLEIKRDNTFATYDDGIESEIIGMITDSGVLKNIVINSCNVSTLRNVRKANSDIAISIDTDYADIPDLAHNMDEAKKMKNEIRIGFWCPPFCDVDEKLLEDIERIGLEVLTWSQNETKKEELSEIRRLVSIGVKYFCTDQAEEVAQMVDK